MSDHLKQYVQYLLNTGQDPLPTNAFDDDWEPIGPSLREQLIGLGWAEEVPTGIRATDKGREALSDRGVSK